MLPTLITFSVSFRRVFCSMDNVFPWHADCNTSVAEDSSCRQTLADEVAAFSYDDENKVKILEDSIALKRSSCKGSIADPDALEPQQLSELCSIEERKRRLKYLRLLERSQRSQAASAHRRWLKQNRSMAAYDLGLRSYDFGCEEHRRATRWFVNTEHCRQLYTLRATRLLSAAVCSAPAVVVDFSWFSQQNSLERQAVCNHFMRCCYVNSNHREAVQLFATGLCYEELLKYLSEARHFCGFNRFYNYFATVSEHCYADLFPREQLVYLTPDGESVLEKFDADKVYILGGIADVFSDGISTVKKARAQGIATARLPLEKYIDMRCLYETRLPIYTVFACLLNLQFDTDLSRPLREHWPQQSSSVTTRYYFVKKQYRKVSAFQQ